MLGEGAKAGTFVEVKSRVIGERAKVPHLSYIGDAEIGEETNIGAGAITANYRTERGDEKQRTVIGSDVHTGSHNVFVAPVRSATALDRSRHAHHGRRPAGRPRHRAGHQVNKEDYRGDERDE